MAVETAGLIPLDAPLPQPRRFTLLDAAFELTGTDRWLAGGRFEGYAPGPAYSFDPCATGTFRAKEEGGAVPSPFAGAFTVYLPGVCTSRSVGPTADRYKARLLQAFAAYEAKVVEAMLVNGDGHNGEFGSYLGDSNMETLGSGSVNPTEGLALLESAIGEIGNGMIHVAPATATYWQCAGCIAAKSNGQLETGLGTRVAVGAGYIGAVPDGAAALAADEEWAFASGPVQYRRGEATVLPSNYAQALDRSSNQVVFLAERDYLLVWVGKQASDDDSQIQAGVLIDRVS